MPRGDRLRTGFQPVIVAHSGCMGTPANSVESIVAAVRGGADAVEFDVQATRDGVPVLFHDEVIRSDAGLSVRIAEVDNTEFQKRVSRMEQPHPVLAELETVCRLCQEKKVMLNLDVKDARAVPRALEIVQRVGYLNSTFLTGCRLEDDDDSPAVWPLPALVNIDPEAIEGEIGRILDRIAAYGITGVNVEHTGLTASLVSAVHQRGLRIGTWTVDTLSAIRRIASLDFDYITSNYPDEVRRVYDLYKEQL